MREQQRQPLLERRAGNFEDALHCARPGTYCQLPVIVPSLQTRPSTPSPGMNVGSRGHLPQTLELDETPPSLERRENYDSKHTLPPQGVLQKGMRGVQRAAPVSAIPCPKHRSGSAIRPICERNLRATPVILQ